MNLRHSIFFAFFSILFLFYPGDSHYVKLFTYNKSLFADKPPVIIPQIKPVPHWRFSYTPYLTAEGVYVVDLPSFTPILERNQHTEFIPASTNKIVAGLVAYDIYKPDDVITVKEVMSEGQVMGLLPNEKITVENLLYGMLIHSGNDAAYALADNYGRAKFVILMNEKATSLGMKNTVYQNPAGLDGSAQHTTPFDLALAARALLNNPYLAKIVSIKEITISDVDYLYFHQLVNVNKLLGELQGIGGLKTGYTETSGENLVSFYKRNGHQFIIVILKSLDRFSDTKNIVQWIEENIDYSVK